MWEQKRSANGVLLGRMERCRVQGLGTMEIGEIRERARLLKNAADQHIDSADQLVLTAAWGKLVILCADASRTLDKRAIIGTPSEKQLKNWSSIRFLADGIVTACDLIEPPPSPDVPAGSGA
jgi:hypothetical protein